MLYAGTAYYSIGLFWLISGFATGWLKTRGDPAAIALWTVAAAAVWPWFVVKILWDIAHDRQNTDFQ